MSTFLFFFVANALLFHSSLVDLNVNGGKGNNAFVICEDFLVTLNQLGFVGLNHASYSDSFLVKPH